jgi:hypothetical protein
LSHSLLRCLAFFWAQIQELGNDLEGVWKGKEKKKDKEIQQRRKEENAI